MERIVSLTTVDENGKTQTWEGGGRLFIRNTVTPVLEVSPSKWPKITYVHVYLVPDPQP